MDIRWKQRYANFNKALYQLNDAVTLMSQRPLSRLEKQGVVQAFEFTHELAWKTMKDFLESRGNSDIYGSRDATRQAFKYGLIEDGDVWMRMIESRNLTTHTYDEKTVEDILERISKEFIHALLALHVKLASLESEDL